MILLDRSATGQHAPAPVATKTAIEMATDLYTLAIAEGRYAERRGKKYVRLSMKQRDELSALFRKEGGSESSQRLSFDVGEFWVSNRKEFYPYCWLNYFGPRS